MTPWLLLLLAQATAAPLATEAAVPPVEASVQARSEAAPEDTLTLADAVALARAHSPLAAAARA